MNSGVSLRRKLIFWLFPMLILFGISTMGSYFTAYRFSYKAYDHSLADTARDLERQVTMNNGQVSLDLPPPAKKMLLTDEFDRIYYKVAGPDGNLIDGESDLPRPNVISNGEALIMHDGMFHGQRLRIASRYYVPPGSQTGLPVLVQLAETLNKRKILAREILTASLLPQLALIAAAALTLWMGVSKGLGPMRRLHDEIASRSYYDLRPIEESHAPVEVHSVIRAINELMRRLGDAFDAQQRFIANVAHQLRTPLSGLKTQTDLALRQTDHDSLRHSLQQLSVSTDRTVHLVNQMLSLAQVEPRANKAIEMRPLDINQLTREITTEWVSHSLRKNLDLGFEGKEAAIIRGGDKVLMKIMIDNLLDNAIRYTPAGGCVTVRVETNDKFVILTVEDNGPGIAKEERPAVFQRFYRVPGSSGHGSGLGLSIVEEVALAHGASVTLDEPTGHTGTIVKIVFPRMERS